MSIKKHLGFVTILLLVASCHKKTESAKPASDDHRTESKVLSILEKQREIARGPYGSDANNCGQAGHVCPEEYYCQEGQCVLRNCVRSPERCNGIDDNCNGIIDDGFDLSTDPKNCGICGHSCTAGDICREGACQK